MITFHGRVITFCENVITFRVGRFYYILRKSYYISRTGLYFDLFTGQVALYKFTNVFINTIIIMLHVHFLFYMRLPMFA